MEYHRQFTLIAFLFHIMFSESTIHILITVETIAQTIRWSVVCLHFHLFLSVALRFRADVDRLRRRRCRRHRRYYAGLHEDAQGAAAAPPPRWPRPASPSAAPPPGCSRRLCPFPLFLLLLQLPLLCVCVCNSGRLLYPRTRDHGYYWPRGSINAPEGPIIPISPRYGA